MSTHKHLSICETVLSVELGSMNTTKPNQQIEKLDNS